MGISILSTDHAVLSLVTTQCGEVIGENHWGASNTIFYWIANNFAILRPGNPALRLRCPHIRC